MIEYHNCANHSLIAVDRNAPSDLCWTRLIGSGDVGGLRPPFSGDVARNDSVVVFLSVGATATKTDTLEGCVG